MNILWLPPDYRETEQHADMGSSILTLRHASGRITIMEFDPVHILPFGECCGSAGGATTGVESHNGLSNWEKG
jgi:hypothetical protein